MHININKISKTPMSKQVYLSLKKMILSEAIKAHDKLPSTRSLSQELAVSRNVVLEAYSQLMAEGYIYSRDRSGAFVTEGAAISVKNKIKTREAKEIVGLQFERNKGIIDFRTGVPSLSLFPKNIWGKIYRQVCMDVDGSQLDYYCPGGSFELRQSLSEYLYRVRGVNCEPENIIITSGAAQSFSMLAQYFIKTGKPVITEDPISAGIVKILDFYGLEVLSVPVDNDGINTDLLPPSKNPSLIFTTPSHQFPTGAVLPIKRRTALIEYAKKKGALIVEDDYDSEFRFEGYPIQSMQSLAPENIVYVGTFSKTLCPALRIGYMILPPKITYAMNQIKYIDDLHSPVLEQLTLSRFIKEGRLDRHISISKKHYSEKCAYLISLLTKEFGDDIVISGQTAGIHIMVRFKDKVFTNTLLSEIRNAGLNITTVSEHSSDPNKYNDRILIGFGNLYNEEIKEGIKILKSHI